MVGKGARSLTEAKVAGFVVRLVAYVIDWLVLAVTDYAVRGALTGAGLLLADAPNFWGDNLLPLSTGLLYFGYCFSTTGQTLGKRLLGLRVVRADGGPLRWQHGLLRYIGYLASTMAFFLGFVLIALDPRHQGLHDKLAGTLVVQE